MRVLNPRTAIAALLLACLIGAGCGKAPVPAEEKAPAKAEAPADEARELAAVGEAPTKMYAEFDGVRVTLHWEDALAGDYNVDHVVNGMDVFPLAARFGQNSDFHGHTADDPLNNCIDGNKDGTLTGMDLFPISTHFMQRIDAWNVYFADQDNPGYALLTAEPVPAQGCWFDNSYAYDIPIAWETVYRIKALDEDAGEESSFSELFTWPDGTPPVWEDTAGVQAVQGFSGEVELYWNSATDARSNPVSYNVYWSTVTPIPFDGSESSLMDVDAVPHWGDYDWQFKVEGLEDETQYYFAVRAQDSAETPNEEENWVELPGRTRNWDIAQVDNDPKAGRMISHGFDGEGDPMIAYSMKNPPWELRFARRDTGTWQLELLDDDDPNGYINMAVDSQGHPGVAFVSQWGWTLEWAKHDGFDWQTEIIMDTPSYGATWLRVAFDAEDTPMVSMSRFLVEEVGNWFHFLKRTDSGWTSERIMPGYQNALGISPDGVPTMLMWTLPDDELWLGERIDDEWSLSLVDEDAKLGHSLEFDSQGRPVIGFITGAGSSGWMNVGRRTDSEWTLDRAAFETAPQSDYSSMRLDPCGNPYYVFSNYTYRTLQSIRRYGDSWIVETIEDTGDTGDWCWLEFDPDGNPTVSYKDTETGAVKFAEYK